MHVRAGCDSVLHTSSNHVFWQIRLQILANNIYMYQITRHCQQVYNELDRNISYNSQEQLLSGTRPIRSSFFGGKRQVIKVCANSIFYSSGPVFVDFARRLYSFKTRELIVLKTRFFTVGRKI